MFVEVRDIKLNIEAAEYAQLNQKEFVKYIAAKMRINKSEINDFYLVKQSIDARNKSDIKIVYTFVVDVNNGFDCRANGDANSGANSFASSFASSGANSFSSSFASSNGNRNVNGNRSLSQNGVKYKKSMRSASKRNQPVSSFKILDDEKFIAFRDNKSIEMIKKLYHQGEAGGLLIGQQPTGKDGVENISMRNMVGRPIVVGSGPAGLFCAYVLAVCGFNPLVIERGSTVDKRDRVVNTYFAGGELDVNSNVQFGEGGAGTFSDGKLTTRINDQRCNMVMEAFVSNGAPESIKYQAMPHIGTDELKKVIPNIRSTIENMGGEFMFDTTVVDVTECGGLNAAATAAPGFTANVAATAAPGFTANAAATAAPGFTANAAATAAPGFTANAAATAAPGFTAKASIVRIKNNITGEENQLESNCVVFAIGHSARDTFEMLLERGFVMEQKAFSVGARIEHKQSFLDEAQYGDFAGREILGKATYQLFTKGDERTAYTFCMCPGGKVVAAASEQNTIVTNGMSEYARDGENCNAAFVVAVGPGDFDGSHPLAGMEFQRTLESRAFAQNNGRAPVQTVGAFLDNVCDQSSTFAKNEIKPTYPRETECANLNDILPLYVSEKMKGALGFFDKRIHGFACNEAVFTGVETRTSSPVRITRTGALEAVGKTGIFMAGEGPGYAGGIMSAAVDGIRVAESILRMYKK